MDVESPSRPCHDRPVEHDHARLHETIETSLPVDDAFAFIADFANAQRMGPRGGDVRADRPRPGGRRRPLPARSAHARQVVPMEYRITTYEPSTRVILTGEGSNVPAVDEIRFEPTDPAPGSTTPPTSTSGA